MSYQKNWPTWLAYTASVVVFLVVAGYAVMYATGYRIDFQTGKLRKTGVLAVTSHPSGATIYINDRKSGRGTPLTLRNMLPGVYSVKLELQGYRPFKKQVEIISSRVTEEHNLDLLSEQPITKPIAQNVSKVLDVGNEIVYFSKDRKLMKTNGSEPAPIAFDRLPANVKSVLSSASDIYLAKKSGGNTWALGVVSGGRKWLMVADFREGYRGQLFGTPLNQTTAEKFTWVDNDRFVALIGTSLYAVDLNLNRINQYAKNLLGASYQNGKLYYIVRNPDGSYTMMRDGNLFDDKPGEAIIDDLPVGKSYEIVFMNDERSIVMAHNNMAGLWLWDSKGLDPATPASWHKVASNVSSVWYEHHNLKPMLYYTNGRTLMEYDLVKATDVMLHTFAKDIRLSGKRGESLFLVSNDTLSVSDTAGANVYEITNIASKSVFLGNDSRRLWILSGNELTEWTLRGSDPGIFGELTNFWTNPASSITAG